jgi:AcrR family transcriptional regulator
MPRRYDLGKRVDEKLATRRRIVTAAAELFRERGASHTSMAEVARRADVAKATVHNHFTSADVLARAVAAQIIESLQMPGPELFEDLATTGERVAALARALGDFYDRSQPWYQIPQLEAGTIPAWQEAEADYYAALDRLTRAALGPLATDDAVGVVKAMLEPAVFASLRSSGATTSSAAAQIGAVLNAWLAPREPAVRR